LGKIYGWYLEIEGKKGLCETWEECRARVAGKKARYKSFVSREACEAWLAAGAPYEKKKPPEALPPGIYFDAGTGRGLGVEVRVTDESGRSLIKSDFHAFPKNEFDNIFLGKERTNNFGELLGLAIALTIAGEKKIRAVFGDSRLVIDFWSRGRCHEENLDPDTVKLISWVARQRSKFEALGGAVSHIPGDLNPADLGFHK